MTDRRRGGVEFIMLSIRDNANYYVTTRRDFILDGMRRIEKILWNFYSLLLMLTPCEISMDKGGNLLLLLAGFRLFGSMVVPNKWSLARRPRLRYCLWNPIFILDKSERRGRVRIFSKYCNLSYLLY